MYLVVPVKVPELATIVAPEFIVVNPLLVTVPVMVNSAPEFKVIFPVVTVVDIVGLLVTSGIMIFESLSGIPISQLPKTVQSVPEAPVQVLVLIVNASWEKGMYILPSPLVTDQLSGLTKADK